VEIPREPGAAWSKAAKDLHGLWWEQRIARQKVIDASITAKAEFENLYDKPYEDNKKVRVADHSQSRAFPRIACSRSMRTTSYRGSIDRDGDARDAANFVQVILDNLKTSGVQQANKGGKVVFSSLTLGLDGISVRWPLS